MILHLLINIIILGIYLNFLLTLGLENTLLNLLIDKQLSYGVKTFVFVN